MIPPRRLLAPRYWLTWLLIGAMWLLAQAPFRFQTAVGRLLGRLVLALTSSRPRIARANLALCFPELAEEERERILREHFLSLGMALVETAASWFAPDDRFDGLARFEGYEHLEGALARGKGVILLSAHFNSLEIGGRLLARRLPLHVMYRPHNNPLIEYFMARARERRYGRAIRRDDVRGMIRSLREGHVVWYAADQNFRGRSRLFVPFFGVAAATNPALGRIAAISGAPVVPFFTTQREEGDGYILRFTPPLEDFPAGDAEADAARVNAIVEDAVRSCPAQYLWVHRRFKSRPEGGVATGYPPKSRRSREKRRRG